MKILLESRFWIFRVENASKIRAALIKVSTVGQFTNVRSLLNTEIVHSYNLLFEYVITSVTYERAFWRNHMKSMDLNGFENSQEKRSIQMHSHAFQLILLMSESNIRTKLSSPSCCMRKKIQTKNTISIHVIHTMHF